MNPQTTDTKKNITPKQKPVSQRKDTPSDSTLKPISHVKPNDTGKASPSPEIKADRRTQNKPEIEDDLNNDEWEENPGYRPEREMPNDLYNETLPPDTRVI